jgi:hypothetical protein
MKTAPSNRLAKPAPAKAKEVTIERDVLLRMMKDQRFVNLLPPLRTLNQKQRRKKKGCGCGAKTKPNLVSSDFEAAKRQIANLLAGNQATQRELKSLLETQGVRLKYMKADNSGSVVRKFV